MVNYPNMRTDLEFRIMNPPRSKDEYVKYKRELLKHGCNDPVYLWNGVILAGYDTYEICHQHDISFPKYQVDFANRQKALIWICQHYLNTIPLSENMKKYLIGKQYETEKQLHESEMQHKPSGKLPGYIYRTALLLGNQYHMAQNTVYKYGVYSHSLDVIASKEPGIVTRVLLGTLKISHENLMELSRLPKEDIRSINQSLSDKSIEHIAYSDIRHELMWKKLPVSPFKQNDPPEQNDIPIKQIPKYNPDSTISSLVLTIPSWISSIERTRQNGDFKNISRNARGRLLFQLIELKRAIDRTISVIKEDYNG